MSNEEEITVAELAEYARRLEECCSTFKDLVSQLTDESIDSVKLKMDTAKKRLSQLEAFSRSAARNAGNAVSTTREQRAKASRLLTEGTLPEGAAKAKKLAKRNS